MTWTQPVCNSCWIFMNPGRFPDRLINPEAETCCLCGTSTDSGIYIRIDPKSVRFPAGEDE